MMEACGFRQAKVCAGSHQMISQSVDKVVKQQSVWLYRVFVTPTIGYAQHPKDSLMTRIHAHFPHLSQSIFPRKGRCCRYLKGSIHLQTLVRHRENLLDQPGSLEPTISRMTLLQSWISTFGNAIPLFVINTLVNCLSEGELPSLLDRVCSIQSIPICHRVKL